MNGIGLEHDARHRYFLNGEGPITSVTTALGIYDKSDVLTGWAKRETAVAAVRYHEDIVAHMTHHQESPVQNCAICASSHEWKGAADAVVNFLKRTPGYQKDAAASMGTLVHRLAEQAITGVWTEPIPTGAQPFVTQYQRWMANDRPEFLLNEVAVYSATHNYAGTLDMICRIGGDTWLLDLKTGGDWTKGTGVYPEMALQLAAYGYAESYGFSADPNLRPMPDIDHFGILNVRPEGYRLVPFDVRPDTFEAFLHTLSLYRWKDTKSNRVMGQDMPIKEIA